MVSLFSTLQSEERLAELTEAHCGNTDLSVIPFWHRTLSLSDCDSSAYEPSTGSDPVARSDRFD